MANTYTQIHIQTIFAVWHETITIPFGFNAGYKKNFIEEYKELLQEFNIDYDERYIFKPIEI